MLTLYQDPCLQDIFPHLRMRTDSLHSDNTQDFTRAFNHAKENHSFEIIKVLQIFIVRKIWFCWERTRQDLLRKDSSRFVEKWLYRNFIFEEKKLIFVYSRYGQKYHYALIRRYEIVQTRLFTNCYCFAEWKRANDYLQIDFVNVVKFRTDNVEDNISSNGGECELINFPVFVWLMY